MRKQITPGKLVPKAELCPQSFESFRALSVVLIAVLDLDDEVIIRVAREAWETVARDLILEVDLRYRRAMVVRMQALFGRDVLEADDHPIRDVCQLVLPVRRAGGVP